MAEMGNMHSPRRPMCFAERERQRERMFVGSMGENFITLGVAQLI